MENAVEAVRFATDKVVVENNSLSDGFNLPKEMVDYGKSVQSYAQYAQDNNVLPEQVKADMARMVSGDLPEKEVYYQRYP